MVNVSSGIRHWQCLQSIVEGRIRVLEAVYGFIVNGVALERLFDKLCGFPLPINILFTLYSQMSCSATCVT